LEDVLAVRGRDAARRADHHRGALIARLIDLGAVADVALLPLPRRLELRLVARGTVAVEERAIIADARGDEILRHLLDDRAPLVAVGLQQGVATPAVEPGGELPAEIDRVLKSVVQPEAAVGRMRMRGVASDEHAADL